MMMTERRCGYNLKTNARQDVGPEDTFKNVQVVVSGRVKYHFFFFYPRELYRWKIKNMFKGFR